jgi:hypothetical protein
MRFERTDSFKADYRRLSPQQQDLVKEAVAEFALACDRYRAENTAFPAKLRVKPVKGAPGVFEMTWSFSGPDGRATWEWTEVDVVDDTGERSRAPAVRWRRIGDHKILGEP